MLMPASGLLISCATTAASLPSEAIFSTTTIWRCVCSSSRVFSSTRCSSVRFRPSRASSRALQVAGHRRSRSGRARPSRRSSAPGRAPRGRRRRPARWRSAAAGPGAGRGPTAAGSSAAGPTRPVAKRPYCICRSEAPRAASAWAIERRTSRMPEHPLRGGVHVAGGALRLVVDGRDDAEDAPAARRLQHSHPVPALEAGLGLGPGVAGDALVGALVDERALLGAARRRPGRAPPCCRCGRGRRPPGLRCSRSCAARPRRRCGACRRGPRGGWSRPRGRRRGRPAPRAGRAGGRGSAGRRATGWPRPRGPSPRPMRTARRLQGRRRLAAEVAVVERRV